MKSIGFGLERVALLAVYRPWIATALLVLVFALSGYGLTALKFDDNLRNVFGSPTDEYTAYVEATTQFVDPENQLILIVEADKLGQPGTFEKLRNLQFELLLADEVGDVYSLFGLRNPPKEIGDTPLDAPLIVDDTVAGLTPEIVDRIRAHPVLGPKLLSADGTVMMYVITPQQRAAPLSVFRQIKLDVETIAAETLAGTGATLTTTGFPALRISVVDILLRDTQVLNMAGALLGFLLSLLIFGSFVAACLISLPAVLSGLVVIGGLGALGVQITIMSNVVPVLVIILSFASSIHLCRAWKLGRDVGKSLQEATRDAILTVGPACILAALTTSVAFLSLVFADVKLVSDFGLVGAVGCMVGALVVLLLHGLLAIAVGRYWKATDTASWTLINWLSKPSAISGRFAADYARPIGWVALFLVLVLGAMYAAITPEYSLREHLSESSQANTGLGIIDEKLGGAFPIHIVLPLQGANPTEPDTLAKIGAVHKAVATVDGVDAPLSLWSLVEWLGDGDAPNQARVERLLEDISPSTLQRFVGSNGDALISANTSDSSAADIKALVNRIETAIRSAGVESPVITGVTVVTAREATHTIANLNGNLLGAILSGLLVVLVAFRSWRVAVTSAIPNVLPLLGTGALIFLFGRGMQFNGVLALTIAFGIAVDGTVHYFNYFNYFLRYGTEARSLRENLVETSRRIGPQLFGTTFVIVVGLLATQASQMPTIVSFGILLGATLVFGLIGALVVLPALMAGAAKQWFTSQSTIKAATRRAA